MNTTANPMKMPVRLTALRHLLPLLLLLLALPAARSQTLAPPGTMSFQGYLTDGNGNALGATNVGPKNYTVVFRIWDSQTGGNELNAEQQTVTVNNGYFSILLGQGSAYGSEPHVASLATLFTGSTASSRYVEMMVVGIGAAGANVTIAPRLQLVSSPYAYLAANAVNAVSANNVVNANNTAVININNSNVGIGTTTPATALEVNGTVQADGALHAAAYVTTHSQGAYVEWNKDGGGGGTYFVNQKGGGGGGFHFDEVDTANDLTERMTVTSAGSVGIATTSPSATLEVNGTARVDSSLTVAGTISSSSTISGFGTIPIGGIILWSGSTASIPTGWALCNGGNGTPNLMDKFVVGAGNAYAVGGTGGSYPVTLTLAQMPPHAHNYQDGIWVEHGTGNTPNGGGYTAISTSNGSGVYGANGDDNDNNEVEWRPMQTDTQGGGQAFDNRPPFYALAYIMRIQ